MTLTLILIAWACVPNTSFQSKPMEPVFTCTKAIEHQFPNYDEDLCAAEAAKWEKRTQPRFFLIYEGNCVKVPAADLDSSVKKKGK